MRYYQRMNEIYMERFTKEQWFRVQLLLKAKEKLHDALLNQSKGFDSNTESYEFDDDRRKVRDVENDYEALLDLLCPEEE